MSVRDMLMAAAGVDTGGGKDDNFKNVTLLLNGDGTNGAQNNTFLDSSTNAFSITRNGNTTQGSFSPYGSLWSNYFNGSTDYLGLSGNTALTFGTGDFCIEGWINPSSTSGEKAIIGNVLTNTTTTWVAEVYNGYLRIAQYSPILLTSSSPVAANTWTHFAITRSGTTLRLFLNGVLDNSTTNSTDFSDSSTAFRVGDVPYGGKFSGYISNLRLVKGSAVYTASFTPSTTPLTAISGTGLLTCQSNRFIDNSSNAFAITVNGTPSVQRFSPFEPDSPGYTTAVYGGSGYFDGSGDYLNIGANAAFSLSGDFTIEGWVYPTGLTNELDMLCLGNQGSGGLLLYVQTSTQKWRLYSSGELILSSTTVKNNQWYHVAIVRSGSTITMYVNGSSVGTTTNSSTFTGTSGSGLVVGGAYDGSTYTATAASTYITDVRVVKSAVYTTTFTPPTSPLTAISNTVALTNMTNAGISDSAMMNDLETVGNAQVSTSVKKFGTGSIAFDGTGDYLKSNADTSLYTFGTGDFTIEMWFYLNNIVDNKYLIDFRPTSTNGAYPAIYIADSSLYYYTNTTQAISATSALSATTWYHVAVCRSGTSTKMFLNGTQVGSTYSDSTNYLCDTNRPFIGIASRSLSNEMNGYIDDLRITKGYARYTANFTPPTAALPVK